MDKNNSKAMERIFKETESMMDDMIDRVLAREGEWYKTQLAEKFQGRVSISDLETLCDLLSSADFARFQLEIDGLLDEEDASRFDDKVFLLACIAEEIAGNLEQQHPQEVARAREKLSAIAPMDEEDLEDFE